MLLHQVQLVWKVLTSSHNEQTFPNSYSILTLFLMASFNNINIQHITTRFFILLLCVHVVQAPHLSLGCSSY